METRRSFFEEIAMLSALAALLQKEGYAQAKDAKMASFWDAYFEEAKRDPTHVSKGSTDASLLDPGKKVELIQATPNGLRYPDSIADSELTKEPDVAVTVNPGHFRPAPDDHRAISKSKGCQIRLDFVQTRPIMNLLAPMAWSAMAAWSVDKTTYSSSSATDLMTGKKVNVLKVASPAMPSLQDLDFRDPNDPTAPVHNQVIFMGGSGRLALNVRAVSVNQRLRTVLNSSVSYASMVAPFFGFAPLAIPALKAFTEMLGAVFNHEAVIMNSMPMQVLASQDAKNAAHDAGSVKIVSGDFIAVPGNQTSDLKSSFDKLRVVNGWLVHQDAKADVPVETRAQDPQVPPVTYMSMNFTVQSLADAQKQKSK
jgi:hypothetical protein